jgi:hypothetical protein
LAVLFTTVSNRFRRNKSPNRGGDTLNHPNADGDGLLRWVREASPGYIESFAGQKKRTSKPSFANSAALRFNEPDGHAFGKECKNACDKEFGEARH